MRTFMSTAACILLFLFTWLPGSLAAAAIEGIGVNWGTIAQRQFPPKTTVKLLQDNGFKKVKLFDADPDIISSLAGTGIELMIAAKNDELEVLCDYPKAKDWVKNNVVKYKPKDKDGVKITLVGLGNEPFLSFFKDQFTNTTLPALKNVHKAIGEAGLNDTVKVTIPLNADVYYSPSVPSGGQFRGDIADLMVQVAEFYNETGNPFMVNIYPFLSYATSPNFPIQYAFFDGKAEGVTDTNGIHYTNVFDAIFDTLIVTLGKAGIKGMPIVIGEIGWPTDGDVYASNKIAEKFYDGLLKKAAMKLGTPLRPKTAIEMYLFGLYDEDLKSVLPGNFERHWGIFGADGQPKFPMDLAGTGKKQLPVGVKGVEYLPKEWCVYNADAKDASTLSDSMKYACDRADCTTIDTPSSCSSLDEHGKASYVFNLYYQNQNQAKGTCDFKGLAKVTKQDPSTGNCTFSVGIDTSKFAMVASSPAGSPAGSPAASASPGSPKSSPGSSKSDGSSSGSGSSKSSGSSSLHVPLLMYALLVLFRLLV